MTRKEREKVRAADVAKLEARLAEHTAAGERAAELSRQRTEAKAEARAAYEAKVRARAEAGERGWWGAKKPAPADAPEPELGAPQGIRINGRGPVIKPEPGPADTRLVLHGREREPAEFEGRRSLPLLWARLRLESREGELDHAAIELLTALGAQVRAEAQVAEVLAAVGAKPAAIDQAGWQRMRATHEAAIAESKRLRASEPARFTWCDDCHTHTLAVAWSRDRWYCGRCGGEK